MPILSRANAPSSQDGAAQNMSAMLYGLAFQNVTLDSDGGYIGSNATEKGLNEIEADVRSIHNVPGYRLTADCTPAMLVESSVWLVDGSSLSDATDSGEICLNASPTTASDLQLPASSLEKSCYSWAGSISEYFYNPGDDGIYSNSQMDFVAFAGLAYDVNLVIVSGPVYDDDLTSNNSTSWSHISTAWGDLSPVQQNISRYLTSNFVANAYALRCILLRQEGLLEYKRHDDDQTWAVTSSSFEEKRQPIKPFLANYQVGFSSDHTSPPLGSVLWDRSSSRRQKSCDAQGEVCRDFPDFTIAVKNFVYASGETVRIVYNSAAADASRVEHADYFYNVTGEVNRQFYRITYVPVLLLVAFVGIIVSALLVTALVAASMRTWSWRTFRQVDVLRLLVDCVGADLTKGDDSRQLFSRLVRASDDDIMAWSGKYGVVYEKVVALKEGGGEDDLKTAIRLRHVRNLGEKAGSYNSVDTAEPSF